MATRRLASSIQSELHKEKALELALHHVQAGVDQHGLHVSYVNKEIGHGVFAQKPFSKDSFLLEYKGELVSYKEGCRREVNYALELGSFLYFFSSGRSKLCMDATFDPFETNMCRMVNDSPKPNSYMKIVTFNGHPHLCLFALKQIVTGEEIRYDYGRKDLPWRKDKTKKNKRDQDDDSGRLKGKKMSRQSFNWINEMKEAGDGTENTVTVRTSKEENQTMGRCLQNEEDSRQSKPDRGINEMKEAGDGSENTVTVRTNTDSNLVKMTDEENHRAELCWSDEEDSHQSILSVASTAFPYFGSMLSSTNLLKDGIPDSGINGMKEAGDGTENTVTVRTSKEENQTMGRCLQNEEDSRQSKPDRGINEMKEAGDGTEITVTVRTSNEENQTMGRCLQNEEDSCQSKPDRDKMQRRPVRECCLRKKRPQCLRNSSDPEDDDIEIFTDEEEEYKPDEDDSQSEDEENEDTDKVVIQESDVSVSAQSIAPGHKPEPKMVDQPGRLSEQLGNENLQLGMQTVCNPEKLENYQRKVEVLTTNNSENRRVWDKHHCCVFCMELKAKLPRHFEQVHKGEVEVGRFLALPKKSAERFNLLEELRRKGDFAYNADVLKRSSGTIIPCRRPNSGGNEDPGNYIPCEDCLGFFLSKDLWKHKKNCVAANAKLNPKRKENPRRGTHQATSAALLPVSDMAQAEMKSQILYTMANDNISMVARTDSLIVHFGTKLFSKNGQEKHQHQYIKQKMRELARFLIIMRRINNNVWSLVDCINPVLFTDVIKAVKEECQYQPTTGRYQIPSLALKLGHSLKKCAKYLKSRALQSQDKEIRARSEDFQELVENEWHCEISSQALTTLHTNVFNRPKRIPLTNDIRKLNVYLQEQADLCMLAVKTQATETNYQSLAHVTQAQLVLFNRRRGGEIERIPLSQYVEGMNVSKTPLQEDIAASLSPFEKTLAKSLHRIEIRGKRGRKVPVLFTNRLKRQVDLLVENREKCGILDTSNFLFSRAGNCKTPFRSSDALSVFAVKCEADQPKLLQSTNLRFHIGTVSQILNLKHNELDILAGFMGHDIRVHRQYYRLPEDTLQLAKVSKILIEMENGNIQKHKGKSLDEIEIRDDDTINEEELNVSNPPADFSGLQEEVSTKNGKKPRSGTTAVKNTGERRPWSEEEKKAVIRQLSKFIRLKKVPGKRQCEDAIAQEPILRATCRPWQQIKFCVKNMLVSKKGKDV